MASLRCLISHHWRDRRHDICRVVGTVLATTADPVRREALRSAVRHCFGGPPWTSKTLAQIDARRFAAWLTDPAVDRVAVRRAWDGCRIDGQPWTCPCATAEGASAVRQILAVRRY